MLPRIHRLIYQQCHKKSFLTTAPRGFPTDFTDKRVYKEGSTGSQGVDKQYGIVGAVSGARLGAHVLQKTMRLQTAPTMSTL